MISIRLNQKPPDDCLGKANLEVLYEILEVSLVSKIVTSWKEFININLVSQNQCSKVTSKTEFACETLIIIEMVDLLVRRQMVEVQIHDLGGPFQVEKWRPDIFIFKPASFEECLSKFMIASFDDEYFLVPADTVPSPPCGIVQLFFLFGTILLLLFLFLLVILVVVFVVIILLPERIVVCVLSLFLVF